MSVEVARHYSAARLRWLSQGALALAIILDAHAAYQLAETGAAIRLPFGWATLDAGGIVGVALVGMFLIFRAYVSPLADKADNNRAFQLAGRIRRTAKLLAAFSFLMLLSAIYMQFEMANMRVRDASAPVKLAQVRYDEAAANYNSVLAQHGAQADEGAAREADAMRAKAAAGAEAAKAAFVAWLSQSAINVNGKDSGKTIGQILSQSCFVMSDDYPTLAAKYAAECKRFRAAARGDIAPEAAARIAELDGAAAGARAIEAARKARAQAEADLLQAKAGAGKGASGAEYYPTFSFLARLTGASPEGIMLALAVFISLAIVSVSGVAHACADLAGEPDARGAEPRQPGIVDTAAAAAKSWLADSLRKHQAARGGHMAMFSGDGIQPAHDENKRQAARRLAQAGMRQVEIAAVLNVAQGTVSKWLSKGDA
jgi:hypothetical protein